jgi:hypothetical protein
MEVTLRKAAQLSQQAIQAAAQFAIVPHLSLSAYGSVNVSDALAAHETQQRVNLDASDALTCAGFAIRALIGKANRESGIDALLDEKALTDALEKRLSVPRAVRPDVPTVQAQLNALASRVGNTDFYGGDTVVVQGFSEELNMALKQAQSVHRRTKVRIADELLQLNITTKVQLSDETVDTLKKFDIL